MEFQKLSNVAVLSATLWNQKGVNYEKNAIYGKNLMYLQNVPGCDGYRKYGSGDDDSLSLRELWHADECSAVRKAEDAILCSAV